MAVEFRCADVGVECGASTTASDAEVLLAQVQAHAREVHGVELNQTLIDYALTKVRTS